MGFRGWFLSLVLALGCGNDGDSGASESTSAGDTALGTPSSSTATGSDTTTRNDPTPNDEATADEPERGPNDACPAPGPVQLPVPPLGCKHMMLLDGDNEPTQTPSGVVRCGVVFYRIADVPCPSGKDAQCQCDAQCDPSQICLCASEGVGNQCIFADCGTADDCSEGNCRFEENGCGFVALRCTSPSDDCVSNGDCRSGSCQYDDVQEMFICDGETCHAE